MLDQVRMDLKEALDANKLWFCRDPFKKTLVLYRLVRYDLTGGTVYFKAHKKKFQPDKLMTVTALSTAVKQWLFYPAALRGGKQ